MLGEAPSQVSGKQETGMVCVVQNLLRSLQNFCEKKEKGNKLYFEAEVTRVVGDSEPSS